MAAPNPEALNPAGQPIHGFPSGWLTQVQVRHLIRTDLQALEWRGAYAHFRRLYAEAYRRARRGQAVLWVAEWLDAGVIGQLFVLLQSGRLELADGSRRAYLHSFRLQPRYRGGGLGTHMLEVAETDLHKRGFQVACLTVGRDNLAAQRLYTRLGYQTVAAESGRWQYMDHTGLLRQVHEPAWRMEKALAVTGN